MESIFSVVRTLMLIPLFEIIPSDIKQSILIFVMKINPHKSNMLKNAANLMLMAFSHSYREVACETITLLFKCTPAFDCVPFTEVGRKYFQKHLMTNTFFNIQTGPNLHQKKFRQVLFDTALKTNQLSVLKQMCGDENVPHTLKKLLCYFVETFDLVCGEDYLALLVVYFNILFQ
jgi:hypothetical protein